MGISGRILHVEIDLEHIMSLFAGDLRNGTVQVKGKFTLTIQCKEGWTKN